MQFGGQTAIKLTQALLKMGVPILGTSAKDVDAAEDRELFDEILEEHNIPRAAGKTVFKTEEAIKVTKRAGLSGTGPPFICLRRCRNADCSM